MQYMANEYNKRASKFFFSVNDWCYVKINVPTNKFGPRWKGPFKIVKKLSDILYLVKIDGKDIACQGEGAHHAQAATSALHIVEWWRFRYAS